MNEKECACFVEPSLPKPRDPQAFMASEPSSILRRFSAPARGRTRCSSATAAPAPPRRGPLARRGSRGRGWSCVASSEGARPSTRRPVGVVRNVVRRGCERRVLSLMLVIANDNAKPGAVAPPFQRIHTAFARRSNPWACARMSATVVARRVSIWPSGSHAPAWCTTGSQAPPATRAASGPACSSAQSAPDAVPWPRTTTSSMGRRPTLCLGLEIRPAVQSWLGLEESSVEVGQVVDRWEVKGLRWGLRGAHVGGEICSFQGRCPQKYPNFLGVFHVFIRRLQYQTKVSRLINSRRLGNIGDVSKCLHTYTLVVWVSLALKKVCFLGTRPRASYMGIPMRTAYLALLGALIRPEYGTRESFSSRSILFAIMVPWFALAL